MRSYSHILTASVLSGFLFAVPFSAFAWTGPTSAPPNGNVSAPINVGTTDQIKNASLGTNSLAVFGNSILSGPSITYLNFGNTSGSSGYGIRDNNGVMEFKNVSGVWQGFLTYVPDCAPGQVLTKQSGVFSCASRVTPGSQTYSAPGTYTFTVPAYNTLSVQSWGAGGGAGSGCTARGDAYAGGATSFESVTAGGGGAGPRATVSYTVGGTAGIASGGDVNTNGQTGGFAIGYTRGGYGGAGANGGAGGAPGVRTYGYQCYGTDGSPGSFPGGGGGGSSGGSYNSSQNLTRIYGAAGGGGGGYAQKTYAAGALSGSVTVTVGAGGAGGIRTNCGSSPSFAYFAAGGAGADGQVTITWQ